MRRFVLLMTLLACLSIGGRVHAQESILPLGLDKSGVDQAWERANREQRVLIVVHEWKRPPFGRRPWWMNDTVRAWLKWHAIIVECKPGDPTAREYLKTFPYKGSPWGFDIIINRARCEPLNSPPAGIPNAKGPDDHDWADTFGVGAVHVLYQVNLQLEMKVAASPIWAAGHELNCPEPKAPARRYLYNDESDGFPAVSDDAVPREGDRYADVMARLREADKLIAAGDVNRAFATLTWAWERGSELDPAFAIARTGLVLPRMAALRAKESEIGDRMAKIGEAEVALYPWFDDREELSYLCLRYQAGEKDKVISRTIVENIDPDEQTMDGLIPARLADLKVRITELTSERAISAADWKGLMRTVRLRTPSSAPKDIKELWRRARVELAAAAAIRTYATLLASESRADRDRADTIAQDVLKEAASAQPAVRASVLRALVMAAVSVGKADSRHLEWLDEAAKIDPPGKGTTKATGDPLRAAIGVGAK